MIDENEQLSSMSFYDMVRKASTPEHNLSGIIDAFEAQADMIDENESDIEPLRDGIESLGTFDKGIRAEICSYIIDLVRSRALDPADIPNLVRTISYRGEADTETLRQYGASEGAMTWSNFSIMLHDSLKVRDEAGHFAYDIKHHFGHELGHSVLESEAVSLSEVAEFFDSLPFDFETRHVLNLRKNEADPELTIKERFAELVGFYLQARCAENSFKGFLHLRAEASSAELESNFENDEGKRFIKESRALFDFIDSRWVVIREHIAGNGFLLDEEFDADDLIPETPLPLEQSEGIPGNASASMPDLKSESKVSPAASQSKSFKESPDLGKREKHGEGFLKLLGGLLAAFSTEVDPLD